MRMRKRYWFGFLGLLILSCGNNPVESSFIKDMSVFSVLSPHHNRQEVYVYYTTDRVNEPVDFRELFLKDAQVHIQSRFQNIQFHYFVDEKNNPMFIDLPDTLHVLPGETYSLTVKSDVGEVQGKVTVPETFHIVVPQLGDTLPFYREKQICWSRSRGASGFIINITLPPETFPSPIDPDSTVTRRSLESFVSFDTCFVVPDWVFRLAGDYLLEVMAFEENVKRHLFDGYDISGIEGGYGYFGGTTVDSVSFHVQ